MLHKGFTALAALGSAGFFASLVGALQGGNSPSNSDALWVAAMISLGLLVIGGAGWLLTRDDTPPKSTAEAKAKDGGAAFAAGGDIKARDIYVGTAPPAPKKRKPSKPSFDIQHQPAADGWVHLLITNFAEPGEFYADVAAVENTTDHQTTPYSVKWRGHDGERRHVVKQALIDLAQAFCPQWDEPGSGVVIISPHRRKVGDWRGGNFELFSARKPEGWTVESGGRFALTPAAAALARAPLSLAS
jgi:hypothetical protein